MGRSESNVHISVPEMSALVLLLPEPRPPRRVDLAAAFVANTAYHWQHRGARDRRQGGELRIETRHAAGGRRCLLGGGSAGQRGIGEANVLWEGHGGVQAPLQQRARPTSRPLRKTSHGRLGGRPFPRVLEASASARVAERTAPFPNSRRCTRRVRSACSECALDVALRRKEARHLQAHRQKRLRVDPGQVAPERPHGPAVKNLAPTSQKGFDARSPEHCVVVVEASVIVPTRIWNPNLALDAEGVQWRVWAEPLEVRTRVDDRPPDKVLVVKTQAPVVLDVIEQLALGRKFRWRRADGAVHGQTAQPIASHRQ
mmetsp:Transcript_82252/g.209019  ORF Transcript_82252/g.209019 Transcript_82252/m.209019 type:complete len:314 (-) Transcript_82252:193-1134(-)